MIETLQSIAKTAREDLVFEDEKDHPDCYRISLQILTDILQQIESVTKKNIRISQYTICQGPISCPHFVVELNYDKTHYIIDASIDQFTRHRGPPISKGTLSELGEIHISAINEYPFNDSRDEDQIETIYPHIGDEFDALTISFDSYPTSSYDSTTVTAIPTGVDVIQKPKITNNADRLNEAEKQIILSDHTPTGIYLKISCIYRNPQDKDDEIILFQSVDKKEHIYVIIKDKSTAEESINIDAYKTPDAITIDDSNHPQVTWKPKQSSAKLFVK